MASTEEMEAQILAEMESNPEAYAVEENNALVIDNDLRTISIPEGIKNLGVESDDDVHRLYFQMPKVYGEFDLSTFDIRINYKNGYIGDVYAVEDKNADGDVITFSWLVGRNAVKTKGTTQFIVCLKKSDASGVVQHEFNTTVASLNVLEGLETAEKVIQANADIIEQILKKIDGLTSISQEDIANAVADWMIEHPPSGMTAEEKEQLQKNTEDISSLSEDKVTNPTSGAVGQILEIETVDEGGKPKTYKAVDKPTGDGTGTGGSYTLPIATSEVLGGVKPVSKTDAMTQEVGVDSEGKLYTEPTTSSGGSGDGFIADGSITTEKIVDGAVTPEKTAFFDIVKSGISVLKTLPDGSKSKVVDSTYYNIGAKYGQIVFHVSLKAGKKYMIVQNETGNAVFYSLATFNGAKPSADYTTDMIWLPLADSDGSLTGEYSDAVITRLDTSQPSSTYQWWTGEYNEYGNKTYNIFTYDDSGTTLKIVYYAFTIDKDFEGLISFGKTGAANPDYVEILEFEDIETAYNPLHDGFPVTSESTTKSEEYVKESYLEKPVKTIMKDSVSIVSPLNGLKWCALGDSLTDWGGGNCDIGNDADFGFITQIMRETGIIGTNKGYAGGHWTSDANETDGYTASSAVKNVNDIINGNVDYDIVTIAYGTNSDTNGDGTVEDVADQYATMCGAIKWCIEKLITWKPSLQIGIILPPQRADMGTSGNISMRTRGDLIKSVAELYSIPCCDMWRESGINTMTYKTTNSEGEEVDAYYYLSDGLHLGGENRDYNGYKKYGAKLKSFLESIAPVY